MPLRRGAFRHEQVGRPAGVGVFPPDEPVPALLQYVEDRDIWKWEFAQSAPFLSALGHGAQNLRALEGDDPLHPEQLDAFMARGAAMDEKFRKMATTLPRARSRWCSTALPD